MDHSVKKLFLCKEKGCNKLFTEEVSICTHVEKHKTQSNLSLENRSTNMFADNDPTPTPTPTQLINNCEEIGLFDDLKHVNPNVETFQRAVESKQIDYQQQQQHHNQQHHDQQQQQHHDHQQQQHHDQQQQQQKLHHQQEQHYPNLQQQLQQNYYHHQQKLHYQELLHYQEQLQKLQQLQQLQKLQQQHHQQQLLQQHHHQQHQHHHQQQQHHHHHLQQQQHHLHHHQLQQQHISTDDNGTYDTASANNCLITNNDSLHTPQIFPNVGSATTSGTKTTSATSFFQREDFLMPKQDVILSETTLIDNHEKTCNTNSTSELSENIEKDVKKYRPRQKKKVSEKSCNESSLQKRREASGKCSEQNKRENANVKKKNAKSTAKKCITENEMLQTTGEGCSSNTSSNNLQNRIQPVYEKPKYIRCPVIVRNIAYQQNQQQPPSKNRSV